MLRCVVGVFLGLAACSGDGLEYDGTPGAPTPVTLGSWVPRATVSVAGTGARSLLVDTGAPLTVLDSDSFPALPQGSNEVDLGAFGMTIHDISAAVFDVFETPPAQSELDGVLGGDVLRHFTLSVDYQGARVWLDTPGAGAIPQGVAPASIEDTRVVEMDVAGGGLARLPGDCPGGCGTACIDATRLLVRVRLESLGEPVWMIVDTGASAVVLSPETMLALGDAGRPRLDGVTVDTASGNTIAYLTRVGSMGLGAAEQTSVPVLVLDSDLFAIASQEVGLPIAGLVGGSFLRHYLISIDYDASELRLARFVDSSHIDQDEYVRVGFTMKSADGQWVVADVYPGTKADAAGLAAGETVAEIDGAEISAMDRDEVKALLDQFSLGQQVPVGVQRDAGVEVVLIEVEDLLPGYGGS